MTLELGISISLGITVHDPGTRYLNLYWHNGWLWSEQIDLAYRLHLKLSLIRYIYLTQSGEM